MNSAGGERTEAGTFVFPSITPAPTISSSHTSFDRTLPAYNGAFIICCDHIAFRDHWITSDEDQAISCFSPSGIIFQASLGHKSSLNTSQGVLGSSKVPAFSSPNGMPNLANSLAMIYSRLISETRQCCERFVTLGHRLSLLLIPSERWK